MTLKYIFSFLIILAGIVCVHSVSLAAGTFPEPSSTFPNTTPLGVLKVRAVDVSQGVAWPSDGSGHLNRDGVLYKYVGQNGTDDIVTLTFGNQLSFRNYLTGGTALMINSGGNVGIGMAPVSGAKLVIGGSSATALQIDNGGDILITHQISGGDTSMYNDSGTLVINTTLNAPILSSGQSGSAAYFPYGVYVVNGAQFYRLSAPGASADGSPGIRLRSLGGLSGSCSGGDMEFAGDHLYGCDEQGRWKQLD